MVIGVGIDLEQVQRFRRLAKRRQQLVDQVYTQLEQEIFLETANPVEHFAAGFATKEATFKALGQGWLDGPLFWKDVELIGRLNSSQPEVRLSGAAERRAESLGASSSLLSISCTNGFVIAQVLLIE